VKVGMQRFLETERGCAVVGDDQFEAELLSELGAEEQMIIAEPGFPGASSATLERATVTS